MCILKNNILPYLFFIFKNFKKKSTRDISIAHLLTSKKLNLILSFNHDWLAYKPHLITKM